MRYSRAQDRQRMGGAAAFALLTAATVTLLASASAPSPIYPLYRERWGFSVALLTVVFAVYVVGLLGALLTVGSLSDHIGRKPVLVAAFLLAATSTALFWSAGGPAALVAARLVQGVASGTAMSGLAAGLLDFSPPSRPQVGATTTAVGTGIGMASGASVVGLLTGATSRPDDIIFPILTAMYLALAAASLALPETSARRRVTLRDLRPVVRVPAEARARFVSTLPTTISGWAATGLFLALIPSLVRDVLHLHFAAAGGLAIGALYVAVTVGGLWSLRYGTRAATIVGAALMTAGAGCLALALGTGSVVEFGAAAAAIGLGVGLTFNGNLRAMSAVTDPSTRSETFAAIYVVSYASLSVPTLAAGLVAPFTSLATTGYAFIAFIALLAAFSLIHATASRNQVAIGCHRRRTTAAPSGEPRIQP